MLSIKAHLKVVMLDAAVLAMITGSVAFLMIAIGL